MNLQTATQVTNPVCTTGVDVRHVPALRGDGPELPDTLDLLARLAFLARLACRNRVAILGCRYGNEEP